MESARELANNLKSKPREVPALGKALFYRQLEATLGAAYSDALLAKVPPRWKG
jgi:hypothetical protein